MEHFPAAEQFELGEDLQTQIEAASRSFWQETAADRQFYSEEEDFERSTAFVERELAFARILLSGLSALQERYQGNVTVLFDVDETIGKLKCGPDGNTHWTVTRPALAPVIQAIAAVDGQVRFGLLSSRHQSSLDQEAHDRTYTTPFGDAFDPRFVVSSRDGAAVRDSRATDLKNWGDTTMKLEAIPTIVDPSISADNEPWWNWFDEKLVAIEKLAQDNPDQAFLIVDDLEFVKAINPEHPQVHGIRIDESARFSGR